MMTTMSFRTVVTVQIPVEHRFAVGDKIYRDEPGDDVRSVWRIIDVGCSAPVHESGTIATWDGPWYRMEPVNEIAKMLAMEAHGRVVKASTPLVELMGPVTERVRTVDGMCEPHVR